MTRWHEPSEEYPLSRKGAIGMAFVSLCFLAAGVFLLRYGL